MADDSLLVGEIVGLDQFFHGVAASPAVVEAALVASMELSVHLVEGLAKARVPRRTGRLFSSIGTEVNPGMEGVQGRVGTNVSYAPVVELGSRPHEIVPSSAAVLSFAIGDSQIFATRVQHPGTTGKHYLRDALEVSRGAISGFFRAAAGRLTAGLAGK